MYCYFFCEVCGGKFLSEEACREHEKSCLSPLSLKLLCMEFGSELDGENVWSCRILEYPRCCIRDNIVQFFPGSSFYGQDVTKEGLRLEEVQRFNDRRFCIYTTDFSPEHEQRCIRSLAQEASKSCMQKLEERTKRYYAYMAAAEDIVLRGAAAVAIQRDSNAVSRIFYGERK